MPRQKDIRKARKKVLRERPAHACFVSATFQHTKKMYGQHLVIPPWQRWAILVVYWGILAAWVIPQGYVSALIQQEWLPLSPLHAAHLIQMGIFLGTWTFGVYTFGRPWYLFSTVIYPCFHILDTLMWFAVFDKAQAILVLVDPYHHQYHPSQTPSIRSYLLGHMVLSLVILIHRKTFELWYLPEHHPPQHIRGGLWYVPAAIISSFFFSAIYYFYGDLKWCVLVKFTVDLYCSIRMRLPSPWSATLKEHEKDRAWDWTGI